MFHTEIKLKLIIIYIFFELKQFLRLKSCRKNTLKPGTLQPGDDLNLQYNMDICDETGAPYVDNREVRRATTYQSIQKRQYYQGGLLWVKNNQLTFSGHGIKIKS